MSDLHAQIEHLSADEKVELLDVLWESLEADRLPLTDAQRAELDRRLTLYERNPPPTIPWEQVREGLFNKN